MMNRDELNELLEQIDMETYLDTEGVTYKVDDGLERAAVQRAGMPGLRLEQLEGLSQRRERSRQLLRRRAAPKVGTSTSSPSSAPTWARDLALGAVVDHIKRFAKEFRAGGRGAPSRLPPRSGREGFAPLLPPHFTLPINGKHLAISPSRRRSAHGALLRPALLPSRAFSPTCWIDGMRRFQSTTIGAC
jgi:hypothetical protein